MLAYTLSACLLAGCGGNAGNEQSGSTGTSETVNATSQETGSTSEQTEAGSKENESSKNKGEAAAESGTSLEEQGANPKEKDSAGDNTEETATPEPSPTSKPFTQKSRAKKGTDIYNDDIRMIQCLGLKEYKKLGTKETLDKASDGNVFLVLFLEIYNMDKSEELYVHEKYFSAKVDGKNVEHTFLKNYPNGYRSIFKNIAADESEQGFIVWEVPKNWKKLVVNFSEFGLLGGKNLKLTATRKDLAEPKNSGIIG